MPERKPILCLDFDGVIHSYTSPWESADVIADPPVPGAMDFIANAVQAFEVHIFSSRSLQDGGIGAMLAWLAHWATEEGYCSHRGIHWLEDIKFPREKPPAMVTLDDRALTFTGEWPTINELQAFQPWYKKSQALPHLSLHPQTLAGESPFGINTATEAERQEGDIFGLGWWLEEDGCHEWWRCYVDPERHKWSEGFDATEPLIALWKKATELRWAAGEGRETETFDVLRERRVLDKSPEMDHWKKAMGDMDEIYDFMAAQDPQDTIMVRVGMSAIKFLGILAEEVRLLRLTIAEK